MQRLLIQIIRLVLLGLLTSFQPSLLAADSSDWFALLSEGAALRGKGQLDKSIQLLGTASQTASTPQLRGIALSELGASQLQAQRWVQAEASLREALALVSGIDRARVAIDLGNLAVIGKRLEDAGSHYLEALKHAGEDEDIKLTVALNLTRTVSAPEKMARLSTISGQLAGQPESPRMIRLHLNLGEQARRQGEVGSALAFDHLNKARNLAKQFSALRQQVEAMDALGQLYEDIGQSSDAIALTNQAISVARGAEPDDVADLLVNLEWRLGRLLSTSGQHQQALAAYQRAVSQIERIRQDMPIYNQEGRSTFQLTLAPVLMEYADLQLQQLNAQVPEIRSSQLRQTLNAIELLRQSEMQDFLGDRCALEAIENVERSRIAPGTALLYPVIFADRLELLLETSEGIFRTTTRISRKELHSEAAWLADSLRNGYSDYELPARKLYDWLLRPIQDLLASRQIQSLVVVPDGVLRLVPIAALHDGEIFAIEKYAISMVTGMSMTNTTAPSKEAVSSLVVGMAEPGPVVDKLSDATIGQILGSGSQRSVSKRGVAKLPALSSVRLRAPFGLGAALGAGDNSTSDRVRDALRLPGVKQEVEALSRTLGGTSMLDSRFTVDRFRQEATAGEYRIIHVASHGVFGGNAESSYIMAFDDVLTLDGLQSLLKADQLRQNPIELLSLSACETAEGDERSPLGIAGAAIRARARSVLGTLWPVDDSAARLVMENFFHELRATRALKTEALRKAQLELLRSKEFSQPFFWAPFVLIGNWL